MSIHSFNLLSLQRQQKLVLTKGVFLSKRKTEHFVIALYQLGSFYVEVFAHKNSSRICLISSFDSVDGLNPYLEEIDVGQLIR